jgi:signal transduction histidine kinase
MPVMGFRSRLVVGIVGLVVGFLLAAMPVLSKLIDRFAEQQAEADLDDNRTSYANWFELQRHALRDQAYFLSRLPVLAEADPHAGTFSKSALRELCEPRGRGMTLITDAAAEVVGSTIPGIDPGADLRERPGIEAALRGSLVDELWRFAGHMFVGIAPIVRGNVVTGLVIVCEPVDGRSAVTIADATGCDVTIVDGDRVVAHTASSSVDAEFAQNLARQVAAAEQRLTNLGTAFRVDLGDTSHQALALPLHPTGATVVLSSSLAQIEALARDSLRWLWGTGAVITALGLALGLRFAQRLARPLRQLTKATTAMAEGNLSARVSVTGGDEIGQLATSFNSMAESLDALITNVCAHAEHAEIANRTKDSFLASMSHELRTPITNIKAYAEILVQYGEDTPVQERSEFVRIIDKECDRLAYLVGQVLDFTNLKSGLLPFEFAVVPLADTVRDAIAEHGPLAHARSIEFAVSLPAGPLQARCDERRLRQAIGSLLRNAVQFSPANGRVEIALTADDAEWQLMVVDHGPGVPDEAKEQIFEGFYQLGNTLTDKPAGAGLGLTIARLILDSHQGTIVCEDRPGGGARFVMRAPLGDCSGREGAPSATTGAGAAS